MTQLAQAPVLSITTFWHCPNCGLQDATREKRPHTRFHNCPRLAGVIAPLLPVGVKAKITAHEREDYVGSDGVRLDDNGRPIMSVITEREDGQDAIVFAPTVRLRVG